MNITINQPIRFVARQLRLVSLRWKQCGARAMNAFWSFCTYTNSARPCLAKDFQMRSKYFTNGIWGESVEVLSGHRRSGCNVRSHFRLIKEAGAGVRAGKAL